MCFGEVVPAASKLALRKECLGGVRGDVSPSSKLALRTKFLGGVVSPASKLVLRKECLGGVVGAISCFGFDVRCLGGVSCFGLVVRLLGNFGSSADDTEETASSDIVLFGETTCGG